MVENNVSPEGSLKGWSLKGWYLSNKENLAEWFVENKETIKLAITGLSAYLATTYSNVFIIQFLFAAGSGFLTKMLVDTLDFWAKKVKLKFK